MSYIFIIDKPENLKIQKDTTVHLMKEFIRQEKEIFCCGINDLAIEYNQLFFSSIRYILAEQINVNWVFKSSFIKTLDITDLLLIVFIIYLKIFFIFKILY